MEHAEGAGNAGTDERHDFHSLVSKDGRDYGVKRQFRPGFLFSLQGMRAAFV